MARSKKNRDTAVEEIRTALEKGYKTAHTDASIDVRRYSEWSIHIRIIDPGVKITNVTDRDSEAWDALEAAVSEDTLQQVSVLFIISPKQTKTSGMNFEFENPTPSRL